MRHFVVLGLPLVVFLLTTGGAASETALEP